jgi:serine/threonine protein kinase
LNFNVKIADFGLSKVMDEEKYNMTSYMGTFVTTIDEALDGSGDP